MNWIAIATVVQAVAAAAIVRLTMVSLSKSEKMAAAAALQVEATQEQMRQAAVPVLMLEVESLLVDGINADPRDGLRLVAKNVGLGPAIEIAISVEPLRDQSLISIEYLWPGSAIGAGDKTEIADFRVDASLLQLSVIYQGAPSDDIIRVHATYQDIHGREGAIQGAVTVATAVPARNNHARFETTSFQIPGFAPHSGGASQSTAPE